MTDTSNLGLPFIAAAQAQKHVTHNEALRILDSLVQLAVLDRDLNAPPGSPDEGERWIVKASPAPTGAWAGHGNEIAAWQDGGWRFHAPQLGWIAYASDEGALVIWNGTAWVDFLATVTALQNLALLGVGTTADATNPFSAKVNNALWVAKTVAEGGDGDLRTKLSKESAAKTLSLLLQTNFSGRAEVGLTGDDDFHFKVSPDGTAWHEGIKIDHLTGKVSFPVSGGPREVLAADRTYYVRTDGSDANSGLVNSAGGAFLTVQKAVDVIAATLDIAGYTVTIQIGDGTYTGNVVVKNAVGFAAAGNLVIQGNAATPANVLISTSTHNFSATGLYAVWDIKDLKLVNSSGNGLRAIGSYLRFSNLDFGACTAQHISAQDDGVVEAIGNYAVSGNSTIHFGGSTRGVFKANARTITFSNSPAFSNAFVHVGIGAGLARVDSMTFTNGGTVTGQRYNVAANGVIFTNGGGANYLPGNAAGASATGGQYL